MAPQKPPASRAAVIVTIIAIIVILACLGFGTVVFFTLRHDDSLDRAESAPATAPATFPTDDSDPTDLPTDDPGAGPADQFAAHTGDIRQFILQEPSDPETWDGLKSEESLDLAGAAANFAEPAEGKVVLQRYHFMDGYTERYVDDSENRITIRVLRFTSASDGDNFTNFYIDANQGTGWGDPQEVPGLETAAAFVQPKTTAGFQRSLAVGDAGDVVAIVIADQAPPASAKVPDDLLIDEFARL